MEENAFPPPVAALPIGVHPRVQIADAANVSADKSVTSMMSHNALFLDAIIGENTRKNGARGAQNRLNYKRMQAARRIRSAANGQTTFSIIPLEINITLSRFSFGSIVSHESLDVCGLKISYARRLGNDATETGENGHAYGKFSVSRG